MLRVSRFGVFVLVDRPPFSPTHSFPFRPLLVGHTEHADGGEIARELADMGVAYDLVISAHGLPNPEDVLGPVVVLGGPMGVGDMPDLDWLAREAQWIEELLARNARLLGICLGAQLTAHVLGHQVAPCPTGAMECGYYPLETTSSDHALPSHVYHWHRDCIIDTPGGAQLEVLARYGWHQGRGIQAYRYGNAMGVQFHPEMTQATITRWLERDAHHLELPGARPAHTHLTDHALHGGAAKAWTREFLVGQWLLGGHLERPDAAVA